ncbi:hypothetical protein EJ110_NYTH24243 [Nymphaea thermarum]|nr:hypothetical protein EJ110_NYTH24243 [Nymphaea thermarum]
MASVPLLRLSVVPRSPKNLTAKPFFLRRPPFRPQSLPRLTPRSKPTVVTSASLRYAFVQYPVLERVFEALLPVVSAYRSVPFASFVAFFALYLLVVRNPNFSRFIRFNAMQAVVLDFLLDVLVLPLLVQRVFTPGRGGGEPADRVLWRSPFG